MPSNKGVIVSMELAGGGVVLMELAKGMIVLTELRVVTELAGDVTGIHLRSNENSGNIVEGGDVSHRLTASEVIIIVFVFLRV